MKTESASLRRVRIYLSLYAILNGMVFWYAIEKLFQYHIGITTSQIVILGIVGQTSRLLIELPTSIIADRWNRRNILIATSMALFASTLTLGLSSSFTMYLIGILLYAVSESLGSGTYQAYVYDAVAEASGDKKQFRKIYPRLVTFEMVSLAFAGVLASIFTVLFGLRASYFLSLIPIAGSVLVLTRMSEPAIERTSQLGMNVFHHTKGALEVVVRPMVRWVALLYLILLGLTNIWYEYYQLVAIDVHVPTIVFGSIIGFITIGLAVGSELAHKKQKSPHAVLICWLLLISIYTFFLRSTNWGVVVTSIFAIAVAGRAMQIYMEVYLHDHVESSRRATLISLLSTAGHVVFFGLALGFNYGIEHANARMAMTLVSLPLLTLAVIDLLRKVPWAKQEA